jgi:oxygen-independent coproporphyrinogen-3 oxidase
MTLSALLAKYDRKVPRYTSYPTAPHFSAAVDGGVYADWLAALPGQDAVSVYLHVPFCEALCLYCGCNTAVVRRDGPLRLYAAHLMREIGLVRQVVGARLPLREIHFGGGTPTALPADRLTGIMDALRDAFAVAEDAAISVELDPRHLPTDRLQALAAMGITRASLGVQDLDPTVQRAVRRLQPVEMVQDCMARLRGIGVDSINLDLIYGLPHQTENGVVRTAQVAAGLGANRIAAFGYAHVPWMKRHQALLPEAALPDAAARYAQRAAMAATLGGAGYVAVGLDHFARPDDALAQATSAGAVRRNFQGYTTDSAGTLLGLGPRRSARCRRAMHRTRAARWRMKRRSAPACWRPAGA